MIEKALAFIFRNGFTELLCFEHPVTSLIEVVRGTVDDGETPIQTVVRELFEEAGIRKDSVADIAFMGMDIMHVRSGYDGKGEIQEQMYYGFHVQLQDETVAEWTHTVLSDGIDNGHRYTYRWRVYDAELQSTLNPYTLLFLQKIGQTYIQLRRENKG